MLQVTITFVGETTKKEEELAEKIFALIAEAKGKTEMTTEENDPLKQKIARNSVSRRSGKESGR